MVGAKRSSENPILIPDSAVTWEAEATFNPSVVEGWDKKIHLFFRAAGAKQNVNGREVEISSIGHAVGTSAIRFGAHRELVAPGQPWERYGCEDPRATFFEGPLLYFLHRRL